MQKQMINVVSLNFNLAKKMLTFNGQNDYVQINYMF